MIVLETIGSGSSGNSYVIQYNEELFLVDLGLDEKTIKIAIDFKINKIVGCISTHGHIDHSKSVKDFKRICEVFSPYEFEIKKPHKRQLGSFKVTALPMLDKSMQHWQHTNGDGSECPCYAFLIEVDNQKLFYVTDTKLCVWNLKNEKIDHFLIGMNYVSDGIDNYKRKHVLTGHLNIDTCKGIIEANRTDHLQSVILCHLSADIDKPIEIINDIKKVAGKGVCVDYAKRGKSWELRGKGEVPF